LHISLTEQQIVEARIAKIDVPRHRLGLSLRPACAARLRQRALDRAAQRDQRCAAVRMFKAGPEVVDQLYGILPAAIVASNLEHMFYS
jgi:hypothetical protein